MSRLFDHMDLRVSDLAACAPFYRALLPLLGFTEEVHIAGWLQFEAAGPGPAAFFGVTEDPDHRPNRSRIAFHAASKEQLDHLAAQLSALGARNLEGPEYADPADPVYYAVYFDDPSGNPLEIVFRSKRFNET